MAAKERVGKPEFVTVRRRGLGRSEARVVLAGSQFGEAGRRRTGAQARSGGGLGQ